jgi:hypothetical protein
MHEVDRVSLNELKETPMSKRKILLIAMFSFSIPAAAACPDLSGTWECQDSDKTVRNIRGEMNGDNATIYDLDSGEQITYTYDGETHGNFTKESPNLYYYGTCTGNKIALRMGGWTQTDDGKVVDIIGTEVATKINEKLYVTARNFNGTYMGKNVYHDAGTSRCTKVEKK